MKEKEILAEDIERFQKILEYITPNENPISEAEPNQEEDPNAALMVEPNAAPTPDANAPMPAADPNAANPNAAPMADPNAMAAPAPDAAPADPNMAPADPNAMPAADPNAAPIPDPALDALNAEDTPGPEDNVLNIDDLTNAQTETNNAIQGLDNKFSQLVGVIDKFLAAVEKNDQEIVALKQEVEKRNPTPIEKLDLRSVNDSFPYNVKPTDFWKEKEATSNYRVGGNEEEVPQQYEIKQSDIDDDVNLSEIGDSFDEDYPVSIKDILNY